MNEYKWDGDWDAPGYGHYIILENGRELEPYEVIEYINRYFELKEQIERNPIQFVVTQEIERLKALPQREAIKNNEQVQGNTDTQVGQQ